MPVIGIVLQNIAARNVCSIPGKSQLPGIEQVDSLVHLERAERGEPTAVTL